MNKVILMGRLTADPELKTTPSGISVTSFSIAVDRNYVKQGEERQADFINIVCWRQRAEFVCRYFTKGQLIALDGSIQTRQYQDKNGNNRTAFEVVADNVYFTGGPAAMAVLLRVAALHSLLLRQRRPRLRTQVGRPAILKKCL